MSIIVDEEVKEKIKAVGVSIRSGNADDHTRQVWRIVVWGIVTGKMRNTRKTRRDQFLVRELMDTIMEAIGPGIMSEKTLRNTMYSVCVNSHAYRIDNDRCTELRCLTENWNLFKMIGKGKDTALRVHDPRGDGLINYYSSKPNPRGTRRSSVKPIELVAS